jgi:hypothetical protein
MILNLLRLQEVFCKYNFPLFIALLKLAQVQKVFEHSVLFYYVGK